MTDPISLPYLPWKSCEFDPISPSSTSMMLGRRTETVIRGTPWWIASFATNWLEEADVGMFDAWGMKASSRGAPFIAYDVFRPRPIAMNTGRPLAGVKAGGGAFDGQAVLQSITDPGHVVLSGLPVGFKFSPGDYVEFRNSPRVRSLHRIVEPATADGSGVAAVDIMFGLDMQNFSTASTVHLEKPSTVMRIDPGSMRAPKSWSSREASFNATEVFFS